jgi:hypothetical protein
MSDKDQMQAEDPNDQASYEERVEKLVSLTVAAAKEIIPLNQIRLLLLQITNGDAAPSEIRAFTRVLLKVLRGERDAEIGSHLPPDLAHSVKETIEQIEAPLPEIEAEVEGLTLEQLLERIAEACQGNIILWQQLWDFTEILEKAETTPPDIQLLAVVLRKILAGERQNHVTESLPTELAEPVRDLLNWLRRQASPPPPTAHS